MSKPSPAKSIRLQYFAILREQRGLSEESVRTKAASAKELYAELKVKNGFSLPEETLKVAINGEFKDWKTPLKNNDILVFIPPVAGG